MANKTYITTIGKVVSVGEERVGTDGQVFYRKVTVDVGGQIIYGGTADNVVPGQYVLVMVSPKEYKNEPMLSFWIRGTIPDGWLYMASKL